MSLDNIELTPFLIAELFKNTLVEIKSAKKADKTALPPAFNFLGNNKSRVAIVIYDAENIYLPDAQLNFLMVILGACKLTMEDVAIVNISNSNSITYKTIESELKAEKIILFGVTSAELGLPLEFPVYQIQQYNNQTYIASDSLMHIETNKKEKISLWNCLKQIFVS